ncbi:MAG: N-acetylmuramoyl-L-alanine amidase [Flavobacteriaceae bacterium]|nr:N-acetylmuramoyl-L-alanine amidase [Mangrovimonas sp.]MCB0470597.1 N-acetylmuramoyl-L-alanine amidase [Flavobacteriaceae bacterium]MCB0434058.1 N-acetylmuramoyl-L-alanine amidase [Mangrovimonas sp.]MCB0435379.1 N-acetylmuramoyl-L-alanine amidase [Mangrovimonas sp.]MCB0437886.1 N-acetylmuramoyl-L-alanine amidase [Mangrovimonas sp.]
MKTKQQFFLVYLLLGLTFFFNISALAQDKGKKFVVVLDAGHGGKDSGNLGSGFKEKDIALNIVLGIGKELEKNPDIKVVYTRKTDVFVDLFVRGKIANEAKADLFVSVHCNAHNSSAHGTETWVLGLHRNKTNLEVAKKENEVIYLEDNYALNYEGYDPNSPETLIGLTIMQEEYLDQSITLASYIQNNFTNGLKRVNRGVKQAGFIVLHQTVMPSVLIEVGFLTNKLEGTYLNSKKGQEDMSSQITGAILKYKKEVFHGFGEMVSIPNHEDVEITETAPSQPEAIYPNIVFKVQIAASSNNIEPKPYNFKGLSDISREKMGALYKYYYGYTSDYNKIKSMLETAKAKGYASAFLVAFKDGEQITMEQALKTSLN